MGLRFRKSFKIAPGVKLNLNKKSSSVTFGGKGAHYTVNSKGKTTKSVGIPGTGIYYTETSDKKTKKQTSSQSATSPNQNTHAENDNNKKNFGCLLYLLAFVAICFGIALYSFLWMPGIVAIICFAIKKSEPQKKKKRLIISIAVTISSFLIFWWIGSSNELTSIEAKWSQSKYDINDTTEVEFSVTPESAVIETLEISENDIAELEYKDNKAVISFKKTGTASIFFTANGFIESNAVEIEVIDKEAERKRIEEEKKKEEERLRAEQEAKAKAEAERIKAEQEAAKKAEEERIAAEKAEQERLAAEKAAAQESHKENEQTAQSVEGTVWLSATGEKYHRIPNCGRMNPDKARQISLSDALSRGYEACSKCY